MMDFKAELARERRARLAAERLLELRQSELAEANVRLGRHAVALSEQIIEKREEAAALRGVTADTMQKLTVVRDEVDIAKRRLWASIETVPDGFAVYGSDARLVLANSAYLWAFDGLTLMQPGIAYDDVVALMVEEGIVDTGDRSGAEWAQMMRARWRRPQPEAATIRLWNGAYIKLVDRRGEDGDTSSMALNITDTVRNQRRLRAASDRAQAASRAKSSFLARMSHELRTPMNGVVGMADLLAESVLDDEQRLYVDTIRSSGAALLSLINDVLDYSRLEAAKLTLQAAEFDLGALIDEVLRLFRPGLATKPVELIYDYDPTLPMRFIGDAGRVRQILTNLIGNAVKFTEAGHVRVAVIGRTPVAGRPPAVTFRIEDTGIGIAPQEVEHIFGEFNQVSDEKNRKYEGSGLGLAICRQLVELMHGKIRVESSPGAGSAFVATLPLPPAEAAAPRRRMRVLAADDNKTNRLVFEKLVKALDIDLRFAENGREAVSAWREFRPDIVFMDISMPEMDGKQATKVIRAEETDNQMPRTPIVALTAHAVAGDAGEVLAAGLDHYLTKPLKKQEIFSQIEAAMPDGCRPVFNAPAGGSDAASVIADGPPARGGGAAEAEAARRVWDGLHRESSRPGTQAAAGLQRAAVARASGL